MVTHAQWSRTAMTPSGQPMTWFNTMTPAPGAAPGGTVRYRADSPYMGHLRIASEGMYGVLDAHAALTANSTANLGTPLSRAGRGHGRGHGHGPGGGGDGGLGGGLDGPLSADGRRTPPPPPPPPLPPPHLSSAGYTTRSHPPGQPAIPFAAPPAAAWVQFAQRYGDFLLARQAADGSIAGEWRRGGTAWANFTNVSDHPIPFLIALSTATDDPRYMLCICGTRAVYVLCLCCGRAVSVLRLGLLCPCSVFAVSVLRLCGIRAVSVRCLFCICAPPRTKIPGASSPLTVMHAWSGSSTL